MRTALNGVVGSSIVGGTVGLTYGAIDRYQRDNYTTDPLAYGGKGLAVGGAIGALAAGVTLSTGRFNSTPFTKQVLQTNGTSFSGNKKTFLNSLGIY